MSNVLRRNRATSEVEYIHTAERIRDEVENMVMNEKYVPKRHRFTYAIPMIEKCRELEHYATVYDNCRGEDEFLTSDEEEGLLYRRKKEALMNMKDLCDDILRDMKHIRNRFYVKMSIRENVVGLIVDEEDLIESLQINEKEKHTNYLKYNKSK